MTWAVDWEDGFAATAPVGSFKPHDFGLDDRHGNAWEWCEDVGDEDWYETSPSGDPLRRGSGKHVFRGGGFDNWPGFLRSADRYSSHSPTIFTDWAGFRVVREVSAKCNAAAQNIPGIEVVFAKRAKRAAAVALVANIGEGKRLWFYDQQYDSPSDPGAFVLLLRTEGKLLAEWRNHGWSTDWLPLTEEQATSYLWACRKESTSGADNAINYLGMEISTARKIPTPHQIAKGGEAERLAAYVDSRIQSDSSSEFKAQK